MRSVITNDGIVYAFKVNISKLSNVQKFNDQIKIVYERIKAQNKNKFESLKLQRGYIDDDILHNKFTIALHISYLSEI